MEDMQRLALFFPAPRGNCGGSRQIWGCVHSIVRNILPTTDDVYFREVDTPDKKIIAKKLPVSGSFLSLLKQFLPLLRQSS